MRALLDREWIRQSGTREVPGHPALYVTTPGFLEYFGLTSLKQLPNLEDERQLADIAKELGIEMPVSLSPGIAPSTEDGEAGSPESAAHAEGEGGPAADAADAATADQDAGGETVVAGAEIQEPGADPVTKAALTSEFD